MAKLGQRLSKAGALGIVLGVMLTLLFTIAGGILIKLGFNDIPSEVYSALGFLFGFGLPISIELSKDLDEEDGRKQ